MQFAATRMLLWWWIQMLHQDESHPGIRWHAVEERPEGFEPAGRRANADH